MLLKKNILVFAIIFLLILPFSYAQICEIGKIKETLRKILFIYYTEGNTTLITADEVKDMLVFYLNLGSENLTVDCSALGAYSKRAIFEVMDLGENLPDKIPSCTDGTKYGQCSARKPAYCYAGALYNKCDYCGCPANSRCGKSEKCETLGQNITCFADIDCGQNNFVGEYFCTNNYIIRSYYNYTCLNSGTTSSKCVTTNNSIFLTYCNPILNQICNTGKSTCQTTVNDSAPTVAITVSPMTVAQGQFFNVTVIGTDDVGLTAIWWWAVNSNDTELNKAHWFSCNGLKYCSYSWLVSTNATGSIKLGANSRDVAYPIAGEAHQASEGAGMAYATLTVTSGSAVSANATSIDTLNVKGRLVDRFSNKPLANVLLKLVKSPSETLETFYTNSNGEFSFATSTTDIIQGVSKVSFQFADCYMSDNGIAISRYPTTGYLTDFPNYPANSIYVWVNTFDLSKTGRYFAVSSSELNIGDVQLWPSADIGVSSDIAVQMNIEYPEEGRGAGNILYKTYHYLSNVVPLNYDARVKLTDSSGNAYYSPYTNLPLSNDCTPTSLNFSNKQFAWRGSTIQTNQASSSTTGVCLIRDSYTSVPLFSAPDVGTGYAKMAKPGVNTISGLQNACAKTDYDILLQSYCTQNSNPVQEQVMTYNSSGSWSSLNCGAFGCNFRNCTTTANQTSKPDSCFDSDNGIYPYTKGFAAGYQSGGFVNESDTCSGSNIAEKYCSGTFIVSSSQYCNYGCSDGACLNQTITNQTTQTNTTNQTTNQTTSCTNKIIDFEDDPQIGSNLGWNPDYGTEPQDVTSHRSWLNSKGIDITGTPNGFVWSTRHSGPVGTTGVVVGFASPNHNEDEGLSDNEVLTVSLLNNVKATSGEVRLTVVPSDVQSINNVPSTVIIDALDSSGNIISSTTKTFTGVTNGVYTPQKISVTSTQLNIAKFSLKTTQHPYGGVYIEDVSYC